MPIYCLITALALGLQRYPPYMDVGILYFPHSFYHILDLLFVNPNQLPIAVDNGALDLNTGDGFAFEFHKSILLY